MEPTEQEAINTQQDPVIQDEPLVREETEDVKKSGSPGGGITYDMLNK
jgi:hypothetical protein